MHEIIYKVDTIKRKVVVFVEREEIERRHNERKRARQMEHLCRFGGVYFNMYEKER